MTTYIGNLFIEFIIRPIWAKFQVINCLSQFRLPYHAWQGLNKIYFLTVPEAGKSKSSWRPVSDTSYLPSLQTAILFLCVLSKRPPILLDQAPPLITSFNLTVTSKIPISKNSHTGDYGFNIWTCGGHSSIHSFLNFFNYSIRLWTSLLESTLTKMEGLVIL